jgi:hypothetical protein
MRDRFKRDGQITRRIAGFGFPNFGVPVGAPRAFCAA